MPHLILLGIELLYMIPFFSQYGVIRKGAYILLAECELVLLKKKKSHICSSAVESGSR